MQQNFALPGEWSAMRNYREREKSEFLYDVLGYIVQYNASHMMLL